MFGLGASPGNDRPGVLRPADISNSGTVGVDTARKLALCSPDNFSRIPVALYYTMPHLNVPANTEASDLAADDISVQVGAPRLADGARLPEEVVEGTIALTAGGTLSAHPAESLMRDAAPLEVSLSAVHPNLRAHGVWQEWLATLARDPEAAYAAALAYRQLDTHERDQWLTALERDTALVSVPRIAMYAPLLAVERDRDRRCRMEAAISNCDFVSPDKQQITRTSDGAIERCALYGVAADGLRIAVLVGPLYLGFVQVLACAYVPAQRFVWVRHDPIARPEQVVRSGAILEGVTLTDEPFDAIIDELAQTILAHQRAQLPLPEALSAFADWFGPSRALEGV